ncbi:FliA/WhiG family RNA polymerase sigma factor [Bacillus sp. DJP31]|uniref:FliA/WhiG family RNA polymerase sigma factor n=1 Tax=Bacillus sp. DJP31 TaxID=3409789 RepID=UPI003BB7DEE9
MTQVSTNEDQIIWQKWTLNRDSDAGDSLMRMYIPLVSFHVQRISVGLPKSVSKDDLTSLGMLGLYDALEKFDPTRDLKFDTYATFRIRGAIIDGLRKEDWLSRSSREKTKKIDTVIEKLEQKYMRTVTAKEIASELGMTEEEVQQTVTEGFFANVLSLDDGLKDQDDAKDSPRVTIKDERTLTPEDKILKDELVDKLALVIQQLNEKEQLVVSLFYKEELTLTEIGTVMGLSTSRISQIHSKSLFKMKKLLDSIYE